MKLSIHLWKTPLFDKIETKFYFFEGFFLSLSLKSIMSLGSIAKKSSVNDLFERISRWVNMQSHKAWWWWFFKPQIALEKIKALSRALFYGWGVPLNRFWRTADDDDGRVPQNLFCLLDQSPQYYTGCYFNYRHLDR